MSLKNGVAAIVHTFLRSHDSSAEDYSLSSFCHVLMFWQWFFLLPPFFSFAFKGWLGVKHQVTYLLCLLSFPCLWFLWIKHVSCSLKASLGAHALTQSQTYALSSWLPFDTLVETWMHWPSYVSQSILANHCSLQGNKNGQKLIQII